MNEKEFDLCLLGSFLTTSDDYSSIRAIHMVLIGHLCGIGGNQYVTSREQGRIQGFKKREAH